MISNDVLLKVNEINNRIKKHNKEVEEQRALRKIRLEQLKEKCSEYESEFGVDLYNENLVEMQKEVGKLLSEAEKEVNESLAKAEKLLALVESGQYAELNEELGIKVEEPVEEFTDDLLEDSTTKEETLKPSPAKKKTAEKKADSLLDIMEELEEEPLKVEPKSKEISQEVQDELEDIGLDDLFDL